MRAPKPTPRFLPTLTEVVQPPNPPEPPPQVPIDTDAMVAKVMQAVAPHIENQLRELVSDLVQEQLRELSPRIQHDLEQMVRAAVEGAVAEMPHPRQP
ncbi:hypothetical protein [Rhodoferax sp.]|uniref:hypothetical protein n=1 Tax=Rhodoferax sp. TaxID=50421 RepID=UPI002ACDD1A2|nr:hypothetical protein [Rhodoferax sp.]MDZ7919773.1 hypothetical protein [Rhodoferax sp.]